jgi:hypothetical protein
VKEGMHLCEGISLFQRNHRGLDCRIHSFFFYLYESDSTDSVCDYVRMISDKDLP